MVDTTNIINKIDSNQHVVADTITTINKMIVDSIKYIDTTNINILSDKDFWFYWDKLTPLAFLVLGIGIGYGLDKLKEYRNFIKSRRYFFHSLFLLKESLQKQIRYFEENVKGINAESDQLPLLSIDSGLNTDNFKTISYEVIYRIMIEKHLKDDSYLDRFDFILKSFSLIKDIETSSRQQEKNLFESNMTTLYKFDDKLKEIRATNNKLLDNFGKPKGNNKSKTLINEIADLNDEFQQKRDDNYSIYRDMNDFVLPLKVIVNKYHYVPLMTLVSDVEHLFSSVVKNRKSFTDKIEIDIEHFNNMIHDYESTLYIYREYLRKDVIKRLYPKES